MKKEKGFEFYLSFLVYASGLSLESVIVCFHFCRYFYLRVSVQNWFYAAFVNNSWNAFLKIVCLFAKWATYTVFFHGNEFYQNWRAQRCNGSEEDTWAWRESHHFLAAWKNFFSYLHFEHYLCEGKSWIHVKTLLNLG